MKKAGDFPANELWGNHAPVCPYCKNGYSIDDCFSEGLKSDECPSCGKKLILNIRFTVEHDTVGDCEANGEMPHELELTSAHVNQYTCRKCRGQWYERYLAGGQHEKLTKEDYVILPPREDLLW